MDRYKRVEKPKADTPIAENEIRITSMGRARNYITYAMTLLQEKKSNEVIFKAMGRAINKSVTIVELIKRRIPGLHQITSIGSTDIKDTWEPTEEGLFPIETTRHVSMITITLSTEELNTSSVGYQCPIPIEMVKPLGEVEVDYEGREGSPRGRGRRGRGGRGRGRGGRGNGYVNAEYDDGGRGRGGRGSGYANNEYDDGGRGRGGIGNGYVNNEYDDGGREQDRSYGRGRGSGRGGRGGRGRGGYNGPPPAHYEGQQDGPPAEFGYNVVAPADHGYDGPPLQGRGRGRGRGGRGRRGRGGFNRSNGPPIQAAA